MWMASVWRSNAVIYVTVPYNKVLFSSLYFFNQPIGSWFWNCPRILRFHCLSSVYLFFKYNCVSYDGAICSCLFTFVVVNCWAQRSSDSCCQHVHLIFSIRPPTSLIQVGNISWLWVVFPNLKITYIFYIINVTGNDFVYFSLHIEFGTTEKVGIYCHCVCAKKW